MCKVLCETKKITNKSVEYFLFIICIIIPAWAHRPPRPVAVSAVNAGISGVKCRLIHTYSRAPLIEYRVPFTFNWTRDDGGGRGERVLLP